MLHDVAEATFDFDAWLDRHGGAKHGRLVKGAVMLGVSSSHLGRVIAGDKLPSETLIKLAEALDRIAELEAELADLRARHAKAAIKHMRGRAPAGASTDEFMELLRGE